MGQQISLFDQALLVRAQTAQEVDQLGFGSNVFIQASLPHRQIDEPYWVRRNGKLSVIVKSGALTTDTGAVQELGIPYGSYPRLVLAYLVTEAVRSRRRQLDLGRSLRAFMGELGVTHGGRTTTRLRDQIMRLSLCQITAQYTDDDSIVWKNISIVDEGLMANRSGSWEGEVLLSQAFFDGVTRHPVPLDLRVLKAFRSSSLAIDLYCWLTYRVSYMHKPIEITWPDLMEQLGGSYTNVDEFRRQSLKELRRIYQFWPEMNIETPRGRLRIGMMKPHVKPKTLITR